MGESEEEAMKTALILGINGQDGSYLAEILLAEGYEVHGVYRRTSTSNLGRISHIADRVVLHRGDLADGGAMDRIIREIRPDELYNEADQDHVGFSKDTPEVSIDITAGAVQRMLETVLRMQKKPRIFQPVSATIFGRNCDQFGTQDEKTPLAPMSPYACAKAHALHLCQYYRREHGLHVTTGIMYNHDSPRRGKDYLVQRIIREAREVAYCCTYKDGKYHKRMKLSNPYLEVDIGYAYEFMLTAMNLMQRDAESDDFVISTGSRIKLVTLAEAALRYYGIKIPTDFIDFVEDDKYKNEPQLLGNRRKLQAAIGLDNCPETCGAELIKVVADGLKEGCAK